MVCAALQSLCRLAEVSLHSRASMLDIAFKISPLLCHPNSWVRHGAIGFFAAVSRQFGDAQVFCFVRPLLRPFLSRPLLSLDAEHLAAALRPPASRRVFDRALAAAAEQTDAAGDGAMMQGLLRAAAEPSGGQGGGLQGGGLQGGGLQDGGALPSPELQPPSAEEEAVAGLLLQERRQQDRLRQDSLLQDSRRPESARLGAMAEAEAEVVRVSVGLAAAWRSGVDPLGIDPPGAAAWLG